MPRQPVRVCSAKAKRATNISLVGAGPDSPAQTGQDLWAAHRAWAQHRQISCGTATAAGNPSGTRTGSDPAPSPGWARSGEGTESAVTA